jgi:hypothetical protein
VLAAADGALLVEKQRRDADVGSRGSGPNRRSSDRRDTTSESDIADEVA